MTLVRRGRVSGGARATLIGRRRVRKCKPPIDGRGYLSASLTVRPALPVTQRVLLLCKVMSLHRIQPEVLIKMTAHPLSREKEERFFYIF